MIGRLQVSIVSPLVAIRTRGTVLAAALLASALIGTIGEVAAQSYAVQTLQRTPQFVVTLLLRAPGSGLTVKLVHAVEMALVPEEALGTVTRRALEEFPGYSVLDSLVSPAPKCDCCVSI